MGKGGRAGGGGGGSGGGSKKKGGGANKRQLQDLRVVQKNLIFVVGLSARIADVEVLKRTEYFGKFGKIIKIVVNGAREVRFYLSEYIKQIHQHSICWI